MTTPEKPDPPVDAVEPVDFDKAITDLTEAGILQTVPPAPTVDVRATATELLHVGARIDAFKGRQAELRATLEVVANHRWETEGAAPSWKVPRLGTVSLIGCDPDPQVNIVDDDAYAEWVLANHPTEAQIVLRIPGMLADETTQRALNVLASIGARIDIEVAGAFLTALAKTGMANADVGHLLTTDGEVVPGVEVTAIPHPSLRVTLLAEAKERARAAVDVLERPGGAVAPPDTICVVNLGQDPDDHATHDHLPVDADLEPEHEEGTAPPPDDDEGPEHSSTITIGAPAEELGDTSPEADG